MTKAKDVLLMSKDTEVMRINFSTGVYEVMQPDLLPYGIRGKLRDREPDTGNYHYDLVRAVAVSNSNRDALVSWFSNRTLLLSRANAKWIYNLLGFDQVSTDIQKLKISFVCRSVSILDSYWVKLDGDDATWDKIDIKRNPLNEVIAQVALHGKSLTLQGSLVTPELTTNGAYAKAWRRHPDGSLWLYKLGHNGSWESKIEVMVSNLLDKMPVKHAHYEAGEDDGKYVCMCPAISTDKLAILPAMEYMSYCSVNGLDFKKEVLRIGSYDYYAMCIVDYLISNRDRHSQNWGFYYDKDTMEIVSLHPLFDHNNAFDNEYMNNKDEKYLVTGGSLRDAAMTAMSKIDFKFTNTFTKDDFLTERQWLSFRDRAKELGLM